MNLSIWKLPMACSKLPFKYSKGWKKNMHTIIITMQHMAESCAKPLNMAFFSNYSGDNTIRISPCISMLFQPKTNVPVSGARFVCGQAIRGVSDRAVPGRSEGKTGSQGATKALLLPFSKDATSFAASCSCPRLETE